MMYIFNRLFLFSIFVTNISTFSTRLLHEWLTTPHHFKSDDQTPASEFEVVFLPLILPVEESLANGEGSNEINYKFNAFGRPINLRLKRNENILSKNFKSYIVNGDEPLDELSLPRNDCHYLHTDPFLVAAISICQPKSLQGLIFLDNATLEIHPLPQNLQVFGQKPVIESGTNEDAVPHIIKRTTFLPPHDFENDIFPIAGNMWLENAHINKTKAATTRPVPSGLTLELALFFDEPGYRLFAPYMNYNENKLQDMLLAYVNGVQALFHHPSLGTSLQIVLVRMDIMKSQPSQMPHYEGERSKLLDSFCDYQSKLNLGDDTNPNHWDMAVYVSALDFFAYENGHKSGVTMGLATVGGVCYDKYACVIAELGTTNSFGKPYPSAGFTSVYILAHEIGHNLGMHHDGTGNSCSKEGYVMSPSRGTSGETQWSTCSAEVMRKLGTSKCLKDYGHPASSQLDHSRFLDTPGQTYTAKKQCEILLQDKDAVLSQNQKLSLICYSMQCKTPHRSGYYDAGPALPGTRCGNGMMCYGGNCVEKAMTTPVNIRPGGWSPWKVGSCVSGCIEKSVGHQNKSRICNNPSPINTDRGCEGSSFTVGLCNDKKVCSSKRQSVISFASKKCRQFSKLLPELDPKGEGLQAPHEEGRLWMGCSIFCKRAGSGSFYTPRIELNDLRVSPYFPDGTWCHNSNGFNYYCLKHHCLPENFQFTKIKSAWPEIDEDIPFSQNAHPLFMVPPAVKNYFSLDSNGKPLQKTLDIDGDDIIKEEDWETQDYIELPKDETVMQDGSDSKYDDDQEILEFLEMR